MAISGQYPRCGLKLSRYRIVVRAIVILSVLVGWGGGVLLAQPQSPLLGRQSCASATCHGGAIDRGPVWNHSLALWQANDPHAGAALLLRNSESAAIVRQFDPLAADSIERYDNVLRTRCISCHATVDPIDCEPVGELDERILVQGVSCESCHGAAGEWLDQHTQADWDVTSPVAQSLGMRDTRSIVGRAETCGRCHIGSRSSDKLIRDMNHDLIAAGHPALRFDLLLHGEGIAPHWDTQKESERDYTSSALRIRRVSRAVSLAAAASLGAERANDFLRDRSAPWPELADYDCFACHQSLSDKEFRLPPGQVQKSPLHISDGLPMWNSWHAVGELPREKQLLKRLSPRNSDPQEVAETLQSVATRQRERAKDISTIKYDVMRELALVANRTNNTGALDWHEAVASFLDVYVMLRDLANDPSQSVLATEMQGILMEQVEPTLQFNRNASEGSSNRSFLSPAKFDPKEFNEAMRSLLTRVPNPPSRNNVTSEP